MKGSELAGKLAFRFLRERLKGKVGVESSKEHLLKHPEEISKTAQELNELVQEYNTIEPDPVETKWKAVMKLKAKLPQLPTVGEITNDIYSSRQKSPWLENFLAATSAMDSAMNQAEEIRKQHPNEDLLSLDIGANALFFGLSEAHPKAKTKAFGWHAYEETVLQDERLCKDKSFRKDEIIDALLEVLIDKHCQPPDPFYSLYKIMRDPESPQESTAALGWVQGYDHISDELLHKAGY